MTELNNKKYPSYEYLHECFEYKPETGELFWKVRPEYHFVDIHAAKAWNGRYSGTKAGSKRDNGYYRVGVNNIDLFLYRVVYIMHHGYNPENYIDHIDRNIANNRVENLREVTKSCNMRNVGLNSKNTSGVCGVAWHKASQKYRARLGGGDKGETYLGVYKNFDDAVKARWQAEVENNWPDCNTTSSAYIYLKENNLI